MLIAVEVIDLKGQHSPSSVSNKAMHYLEHSLMSWM